jgi:hypothetical protein
MLKNRFLAGDLKRGTYKIEIFSERLFGGVKTWGKMENRFTGRRLKKSEAPVYKGREALHTLCALC